MKRYSGEEAVSVVVQQLQDAGELSSHNLDLLLAFKEWLLKKEDEQTTATMLYAWYELCKHVTFELDEATAEQAEALLDDVPEEDQNLCGRAITAFYDGFLPERHQQRT